MALIGTIRKNGWILTVAVSLALGGFILMDMDACGQRNSAGDMNSLGTVGDTDIKRSEFDTYEKLVYSEQQRSDAYQIRSQAWTYFVEKALVENEAKDMGMGVGQEELLDLQFGLNLSPIIIERFKNEVGQPDLAKLANIKNAIEQGQMTEPRARAYWSVQEKEIIKTRLQEKIINAVCKGIFTPKWQAEMVFKESNERRDIRAVRVSYDKVKDEEAPLKDSDYEAFLDENPRLYNQIEETRIISFVSFDVVPTKSDSVNAYEAAAKLIDGLRTAKNDSSYVIANGGSYVGNYVSKDKFPAAYADSVMSRPIGSIVGPLLDAGEYRIVKILDRRLIADSARARHILIREANPENEATIDSLMALIKSGKQRFDSLAVKFSQDPVSGKNGGDLGWFANGSMVIEFNDVCFLTGEQGKTYKIQTQFGWHIVEITGKKFISNAASAKVAVLGRRIEPSKTTQQAKKDKAVALIQQAKSITDLETIAGQQNLKVQSTMALKINDYNLGALLGAGEDSRDVIRWAFGEDAKVGNMSKEVFAFGDSKGGYFDSRYVVAAIKTIVPKGKATLATLKALPEAKNQVQSRKKAEVILSKLQNPSDLEAIASQWGTKVDTLPKISFAQTNGEPRVFAWAFMLETGKPSPPIVANSGVVIIQPITDKSSPQMPADMTMFRRQLSSQVSGGIQTNLMFALQAENKVVDNRFRFW